MLSGIKEHRKALLAQLAQVQALGAWHITRAFKGISKQALNVKVYLSSIGLESDKKVYQTAARLHRGSFYPTIIQSKIPHPRQTCTPLEILEKRHIKLLESNIQELDKRPVYIIAPK